MSDHPKDTDDLDEDEEARAFILARRARFVAAALAGVATAACGGTTSGNPQPCLLIAVETGGMSGQGGVSIGGGTGSGGFQVCLSVPVGGVTNYGGTVGVSGTFGSGGMPQVCL